MMYAFDMIAFACTCMVFVRLRVCETSIESFLQGVQNGIGAGGRQPVFFLEWA
jgi:hypothetical protein